MVTKSGSENEPGGGAPSKKWWEDDAEVDAFADRHRERLIDKLGLSDLYEAPPATKAKPAKGGGQEVKPLEMEGAMSSLVTALTKGIEMGAAVGSASKASPARATVKKHHWFFGDYEEDA